ncbi:MAG TPA: FMN-binding negative transcriptional regulator [Gemmatimonadaceae bacterium]|nr:FMN-binding negative transcriptional regulator [Gemmatimonadaceae bacterium]
MYIPHANAEHRPETMFAFIEARAFGTLVTASPADGLFATHLPLVLDRTRGDHGILEGHVARGNPHHEHSLASSEALVIFQGADAYITPSWYAAKSEHGRVVPTWNYVAVHAYATLRFVDDVGFLARHLEALTRRHEAGRERPWSMTDAPAEFIAQLQRGIVGVELTINRLEGKWKMSQNRSDADIDGVVRGLSASPLAGDRDVAAIVEERRPVPRTE